MPTPGHDTITIYQGEDVTLSFTMNPVENVTGWTLNLTVLGVTRVATVTNGPAGKYQFDLTRAETIGINPIQVPYYVWRVDSGSERLVAQGNFVVLAADQP